MVKIERNISISIPVEKVFSYMSHPINQLEWLPGLVDIQDIKGEGVGRTCNWTYKMMGIPFKGKAECLEHISNERIVTKTTGSINSTWVFAFIPQGGVTSVNLVVDYTIPVPLFGRLGEKMILWQNERRADLAMTKIKKSLEYRYQFKIHARESVDRNHLDQGSAVMNRDVGDR